MSFGKVLGPNIVLCLPGRRRGFVSGPPFSLSVKETGDLHSFLEGLRG